MVMYLMLFISFVLSLHGFVIYAFYSFCFVFTWFCHLCFLFLLFCLYMVLSFMLFIPFVLSLHGFVIYAFYSFCFVFTWFYHLCFSFLLFCLYMVLLAWAWLAKAKGHSCHTKKSTLAKTFTGKKRVKVRSTPATTLQKRPVKITMYLGLDIIIKLKLQQFLINVQYQTY